MSSSTEHETKDTTAADETMRADNNGYDSDTTATTAEEDAIVVDADESGENNTASESDSASEPDSDLATLQAELETVRAEASKNLEGWQRAAADLANYKRRQIEQSERQRVDLISTTIKEILPILDDLDLAFQNMPDTLSEQETNWIEGFKLVQRKLLKMLDTHQVEVIDASGEFDPNLHEAVTHEASDEHESNTIIAELRRGYKIGDRVLRPTLVRVAQ